MACWVVERIGDGLRTRYQRETGRGYFYLFKRRAMPGTTSDDADATLVESLTYVSFTGDKASACDHGHTPFGETISTNPLRAVDATLVVRIELPVSSTSSSFRPTTDPMTSPCDAGTPFCQPLGPDISVQASVARKLEASSRAPGGITGIPGWLTPALAA